MKNLPVKKENVGLIVGRSLANARRFKKTSPKVVAEREWNLLKMLLKYKPYKWVAKETGRGVNTILRVKKSAYFVEYQKLNQMDYGTTVKQVVKGSKALADAGASLPKNSFTQAEMRQESKKLDERMDSAEARERIQIYFLAGIFLMLALITWIMTH